MQVFKKQLKHLLTLCLLGGLVSAQAVMAESDQEMFLKAREMQQQNVDHSKHGSLFNKEIDYHGVFYGYLPCNDCAGIKTTLSLKQHSNYLIVTQPARDSSKEYYEKGKYQWDEAKKIVTLTPKKEGKPKQYAIEEEGAAITQLSADGTKMFDKDNRYTLRRSDAVKTRQVHIH